ncbi:hypothetical protein ACFV2L_16455 [Streptomyces sp. NPDC059687]|uniref:hypothetical protein n=1 Tax=unclassified Streptomyces TaxID=2593676 RepID=UPI00368FD7CD
MATDDAQQDAASLGRPVGAYGVCPSCENVVFPEGMTQEELLKLSWCPEGCASFLEWVPYRSNAQTGLILIAHAVNENFEQ